jgi:neutral amino acid transport system permease protein
VRVRTSAILVLLLGSVLGILGTAGAASAHMVSAEHDGPHINGTLTDTTEPQNPEPVSGVQITVTTPEGDAVGEATSDAEGKFSVPLEGGGEYVVEIDEESLPEGTFLRNPDDLNREVNVLGFDTNVLFPIGPDTRDTESKGEQALTLAANGLLYGVILALGALGLNLIFGTTGLTNFSHGELVTFGALSTYVFNAHANLPVVPAIVCAVALTGFFGFLQDKGFWAPLRRRGTGIIAMMIVSIGLSIFLRYTYQYIFGGGTFSYDQYVTQDAWNFGPVAMQPKNVIAMIVGVAVLAAVSVALATTRLGKATRAVSDNPALAASSGINVNRVITVVWTVGAALAGLSGALLGLRQQVDFQMGFLVLLLIFASVCLGGLGTTWGAMIGALIVGLFIEVSTLVVPAELKNVGALAILILVLLVRPQGILGRAQRVG